MAITTLECTEDCSSDSSLPVVSFNDCQPEILNSEIIYAYLALPDAADFTGADVITEWTTRLSQTVSTTGDEIRQLTVTGDSAAPTSSEIDISGGRKYTVRSDRVINMDIDDATAANYEFARATECGYFQAKMWFETKGGILLGGNTGILGKIILHPIFARGADSIEKYTGTFTWSNKISPDRCVSPIAHT